MGGHLYVPESEEENNSIAEAIKEGFDADDLTESVSIEFILCFTSGCFII